MGIIRTAAAQPYDVDCHYRPRHRKPTDWTPGQDHESAVDVVSRTVAALTCHSENTLTNLASAHGEMFLATGDPVHWLMSRALHQASR